MLRYCMIRVAVVALVLVACQCQPYNGAEIPAQSRAASVAVFASCESGLWSGSGVAVGPRHVLTSFHVIKSCPTDVYMVSLSDESVMLATAVRIAPLSGAEEDEDEPGSYTFESGTAGDLALLEVSGEFDTWLLPATRARRGEWLCRTSTMPEPSQACGRVSKVHDGWFRVGLQTVKGNSGSPLVNVSGRLVGIVFGGSTVGMRVPGWMLP